MCPEHQQEEEEGLGPQASLVVVYGQIQPYACVGIAGCVAVIRDVFMVSSS